MAGNKEHFFGDYWKGKREKTEGLLREGKVEITIERRAQFNGGGRVYVTCPPSDKFFVQASELRGRYKYRTKRWTFPIAQFRPVWALCIQVYGRDKITIMEGGKVWGQS